MKQRVIISTYSVVISTVSLIIIGAAILSTLRNGQTWLAYILFGVLAILCSFTTFYMPTSISADKMDLYIRRLLWGKKIPYTDIRSIHLCQPTMGERRICGSGGWFGYWGWFRDRDLGKYFAYYGKASDCFLITLKNGKKYMLGCKNPQSMVDYISDKVKLR